ncbi:hypothetical protein PUN28_020424 [Cardiocondyla obscurior]|uniref:Uncharacterized protein n=1 Tax=Cardiocondyla obscurior TaxID=286306 RepID=A0AAW2E6Y9_9HYME
MPRVFLALFRWESPWGGRRVRGPNSSLRREGSSSSLLPFGLSEGAAVGVQSSR